MKNPSSFHVGIVGSRRRSSLRDRQIVIDIIRKCVGMWGDITIVSGACNRGADNFAAEYAREKGINLLEFPVPLDPPIKSKWDFRCRAFERNRKIVEHSDIVFALVSPDRTGGTENTLTHCTELLVLTWIVDEFGKLHEQKYDKKV